VHRVFEDCDDEPALSFDRRRFEKPREELLRQKVSWVTYIELGIPPIWSLYSHPYRSDSEMLD
jgi:hypothetical protein